MNRIRQPNCGTRSCGCTHQPIPYLPETPSLAMAYVPIQQFVPNVYTPMEALEHGTLFPQLALPFEGMRIGGCRRG